MDTQTIQTLTIHQMRDMLIYVATRIIESVDILTLADRHIGDGDHGLGMSRGFEGARDVLRTTEFSSIKALLKAVGDTLIDRMGGASGIVFGLMFRGGARGVDAEAQMGVGDLGAFFNRSIVEIMNRGGAKPGDKTMLDALKPAACALEHEAAAGAPFPNALAASAAAAARGRDDTENLIARFGKSSTMGERSLGYPDAGAVSVAIIFAAMSDWASVNLRQPVPGRDIKNHPNSKEDAMTKQMTNQELAAFNKTRKLYQIAFVTRDLKKSMQSWIDNLKIGPWAVLTFTEKTVRNLKVDGKLVDEPFKFLIAISWIGDMQLEIIQPVYGPTIYDAFIAKHGEGLHHIKEQVHDDQIETVLAAYRERGIGVMQTGEFDIDVHYYMNTEPKLDFIYELGNCPMLELPPEMVEMYPPEGK